jgi:hypothetical protein
VLERISDEDYQRFAWFNKHEAVSSPDELVNQLLDDFAFERFIEDEEIDLLPNQKAAARQFCAMLLAFCKDSPMFLDPHKTIDDPRWADIRNNAKDLVRVLFA